MPGLIDAHWHTMFVRPTPVTAQTDDVGYSNLVAGAEATETPDAGFHDGSRFRRAFVWPQAGDRRGHRFRTADLSVWRNHHDHGWPRDFRQLYDLPRKIGNPLTRMEQLGASMVADSPDEVAFARARATDAWRESN